MFGGRALSKVPTEDLVKVLRLLHRGTLEAPFSRQTLLVMGLNRIAEQADLLIGLDAPGVKAVLVAVIAERRAVEAGR